jgi:hypothetical protein
VTNTQLRDSVALSVIGRSANSSGDPADIATSADYDVLRRSGATLGFGKLDSRSLLHGGDFINLVQNPRFELGDVGWAKGAGWSIVFDAANAESGNYVATNTDTSGTQLAFDSNTFDIEAGETLYAAIKLKTSVGFTASNAKVQVWWLDKNLATMGGANATGTNYTTDQLTYVLSELTAVAPANTCYAYVRALVQKTAGTLYVDNVFAFRKRDARQLLIPGTVLLENRTSDPASPVTGQMWLRTDL